MKYDLKINKKRVSFELIEKDNNYKLLLDEKKYSAELVKIDSKTGLVTKNKDGILEPFIIGTEPFSKKNLKKLDDLGTINNDSITGAGSLLIY